MARSKFVSKCIARNIFNVILYSTVWYSGRVVRAWPNQAGHCASGGNLNFKSFNAHGKGGGDYIEDFNLRIVVDSTDLPEEIILDPKREEATVLASANALYSVTLETKTSSVVGFKGFLFRLKGRDSEDASSALSVIPSMRDDSVKLDFCPSKVSAISHSHNKVKTSVKFDLEVEEKGEYLLEVTVVQENDPYPMDDWGYSSYKLDIGSSGNEFSDGPSSSFPSSSPFPSPSPSPSPSPNSSISVTPTGILYIWMLTASFCLLL